MKVEGVFSTPHDRSAYRLTWKQETVYVFSMETYTIGQLAAAVGEKVRTVQFWADAGVVRAVPASDRLGKGKSRRFLEPEVKIARIAQRLALTNSPIGEILAVLQTIRAAYSPKAIKALAEWSERLANITSELAEVADRHPLTDSARGRLRREFIGSVIPALNILGLAGRYTGKLYLVVSYATGSTGLTRRVLFLPAEHSSQIEFLSRVGLRGFIGFKSIVFDAENDLQLVSLRPGLKEDLPLDLLDFLKPSLEESPSEARSPKRPGSAVCAE